MSDEASADCVTVEAGLPHLHPKVVVPSIRILMYADDPGWVTWGERSDFGVGRLVNHLKAHKPTFADLTLCLENRNRDGHASHRLDVLLEETLAQLWFFGIHQINKEPFSLGIPGGGGPRSELEPDELRKLEEEWMKKGGVLMAGDHANPDPTRPPGGSNLCPPRVDHKTFLGLGRALGHKVPRAGLLRRWEGPPTRCDEDNFNTHVVIDPSGNPEKDGTPQELFLKTYEPWGVPGAGRWPHPLFIGRRRSINVFPDHMHEGAIDMPRDFSDTKVWPEIGGFQPQPDAVAGGVDRRNPSEMLPLVAVYDGDCVGAGRVVADSTWHHYFNVNLTNFPVDTAGDSPGGLIGQYYGNLAVWLSPLETRRQMAAVMFLWLATHPLMAEEVGSGVLNIGRTASDILMPVASPCEIHELMLAWLPCALRAGRGPVYFPPDSSSLHPLPSRDALLGSVVNRYHRQIIEAGSLESSGLLEAEVAGKAITEGLAAAFQLHVELLRETEEAANNLSAAFQSALYGN